MDTDTPSRWPISCDPQQKLTEQARESREYGLGGGQQLLWEGQKLH